jgi:hypothetical protein
MPGDKAIYQNYIQKLWKKAFYLPIFLDKFFSRIMHQFITLDIPEIGLKVTGFGLLSGRLTH